MMDSDTAIELKDVRKSFKIEVEETGRKSKISSKVSTKTVEHVVFDGINLKVKKGEIFGVIGLNGSGKSTLLSIMAHIMEPDSGTVKINGKVASILELGMGFHSDMSGRENIYIKGEMYGFSKKQMDQRVEEIIDFSGIRNYIDNPLRTYSSGMRTRLAFSVMVHVDAEVMLLDEIMSTGDASFLSKADLLFKRQLRDGKTVVFASQSLGQIERLCSRAIWLDKGHIVAEGPAKKVCAKFREAMDNSIDIITDFANAGVPDSQYKLAMLFHEGTRIGQDETLYREWLEKAAEQGHVKAQMALADLLFDEGTEASLAQSMELYASAAMKGDADARLKLASLAGGGRRTKDIEEMRSIFSQLAEKGSPSDKFQYAKLLAGTAWDEEDRKEAFKWMKEAADEGNPTAMIRLAKMYKDGTGTPTDKTFYLQYMEKAADMGETDAIKTLADMYLNGTGVGVDEEKAFRYAMDGAVRGVAPLQYRVATFYRDGIGTAEDLKESERWFAIYSNASLVSYQMLAAERIGQYDIDTEATYESLMEKAASTYNPKAIGQMALLYRGDSDSIPDLEKSKDYYLKAAAWPGATRLTLADYYYRGMVFDQDLGKAAELYKDLTYCCDAAADYRLYLMYRDGIGMEKDVDKARFFLERAARRGNVNARSVLKAQKGRWAHDRRIGNGDDGGTVVRRSFQGIRRGTGVQYCGVGREGGPECPDTDVDRSGSYLHRRRFRRRQSTDIGEYFRGRYESTCSKAESWGCG